jgi:hypothetical protein
MFFKYKLKSKAQIQFLKGLSDEWSYNRINRLQTIRNH